MWYKSDLGHGFGIKVIKLIKGLNRLSSASSNLQRFHFGTMSPMKNRVHNWCLSWRHNFSRKLRSVRSWVAAYLTRSRTFVIVLLFLRLPTTQSGWIIQCFTCQKRSFWKGSPTIPPFWVSCMYWLSHFYMGMLPDLEQFGYNVHVWFRTCSQQKQHFATEPFSKLAKYKKK